MKEFLFITQNNNNPYFNLASEEYLLHNKQGYYVYVWVNSPAVIVGINQNAIEEVNLNFTEENGIKVVRRLTGGGAVYHDLGNICYTVIAPYEEQENSFKYFANPVIEYLKSLGLNATFSGRNDVIIDGKKISGAAETVYNGRIMHHGTLLFNTDLSVLGNALNPNKLKMQSKGIKSVKSRVVNVKELLDEPFSFEEFKKGLIKHLSKGLKTYQFSTEDICEIEKLVNSKYSTYEWNIGRSPKGKTSFTERFSFGTLTISFNVVNGLIENAEFTGDFFLKQPLVKLLNGINGIPFSKESLLNALKNVNDYIVNASAEEIVNKLFN
ncbi:MAG: lipoate--protein ligase [Clostridia bacterium]|nr:lipoate--protein ligase [Clostridia bacterium]